MELLMGRDTVTKRKCEFCLQRNVDARQVEQECESQWLKIVL